MRLVLAIFLPLIKLLYLVLLASLPSEELGRSASQLRAIDWLGRWSPHDILAVGMALVLMLGHDATAQRSGGGTLFFAGAVLAMLLAYAWLRGEGSPSWARYLDTNPGTYLKRGLRYLRAQRPHV